MRYHADNATVLVPIDAAAREEVRAAVRRARELRASSARPPVTTNERLCGRCSLAVVCLPEEERLAKDPGWEPLPLSVRDDSRETVHVLSYGARLARAGDELVVQQREAPGGESKGDDEGKGGDRKVRLPVHGVAHVVLHGTAQASTQALHLCAENDVSVSWVTGGGRFVGGLAAGGPMVQRRVRQYRALSDEGECVRLARLLVAGKIEAQLRFVLRATRGQERVACVEEGIAALRRALRGAAGAESLATLLGCEGDGARGYFGAWEGLLGPGVPAELRYAGRTRRPPKDRVSALLGFGYALLLGDVTSALTGVGLEPALGFYHQPRSSAPPLALDLMELFRVPMVDMPVVGSLNRGQWDAEADFAVTGERVWLSEAGRRKFIELYERRAVESWKHSVVGYSLSYRRMIELEARLLEKEWSGAPGLFARLRLR